MNRPLTLRLAGAAVASALAVTLVPVTASATIGWEPGAFAFPGGTLTEHMSRMVVDDDGDRHVVFRDAAFDLKLVEIPANGQAEPPVTLSDSDVSGSALYPELVVDAEDRVTVVWQANDRGSAAVMARTVAPDGTLGALHTLSRAGEMAYRPQVALDTAGVATVVWPVEGGFQAADDTLQMRRLDTTDDEVPAPVVVLDAPQGSAPDYAYVRSPALAVDGEDRVTVTWVRDAGGEERQASLRALRIAADGTPGPTSSLSDASTTTLDLPDVAVAPDGTATVVWTGFTPSPRTWVNRLAPADGSPGEPMVVSAAGTSTDDAVVTVDPQGRATVAWQAYDATGVTMLHTRRLAPDGALEAVRPTLGPIALTIARFGMLDAAADAEGRVTVGFVGDDSAGPRIHAVRIGEDGTASTTHRLGRPGAFDSFDEFVEVGVDAGGRASVAWVLDGAVRVRRSMPPGALVSADTQVLAGPAEGGVTTDTTPTFAVEGDTVQSTLECRIDAAAWRPCSSPWTSPALAVGRHLFEARATDADGTAADATPAARVFTVTRATPPPGPSRACRAARADLTQARQRVQRIKRSDLPPRVKRARLQTAQQKVVRAQRAVRRAC